jgi:hypothetical protein
MSTHLAANISKPLLCTPGDQIVGMSVTLISPSHTVSDCSGAGDLARPATFLSICGGSLEAEVKDKFSIIPATLVVSNDGKADAVWNGILRPPDV